MIFLDKLSAWSYHRQFGCQVGKPPIEILQDVAGVYSSHPTASLSLLTRKGNLTKADFQELDESKQAFRVPCMRESAYLLPSKEALWMMQATLPGRGDESWARRYSQDGRKIPPGKFDAWKEELLELLKVPLPVKEIKTQVSIPPETLKPVLNRMAFERYLLRVGAKSLTSNIISYVNWEAWDESDPDVISKQSVQARLAEKYFSSFGPARAKDFKWWAGISSNEAKQACNEADLKELEEGYLIPKVLFDSFQQFSTEATEKVNLLPQWDSYTMAYAPDGRQRFVDSEFQDRIYGKLGATSGNGLGTILYKGKAIGSWKMKVKGKRLLVEYELFLPFKQRKKIREEFEKIASLFQLNSIEIL